MRFVERKMTGDVGRRKNYFFRWRRKAGGERKERKCGGSTKG